MAAPRQVPKPSRLAVSVQSTGVSFTAFLTELMGPDVAAALAAAVALLRVWTGGAPPRIAVSLPCVCPLACPRFGRCGEVGSVAKGCPACRGRLPQRD
eukprot:3928653-Alexandrium_andersonii.AAC.1